MASTAEDQARLLVSIEATQKKFEKQLASIAKKAGDTAGGIEKGFQKANDNVSKGFERGARKATVSIGQQRAAAQNLSFQLNDIATGLLSGQSPFRIMAQQGGQVVQVINGAGGIRGAVGALGGAITQMLNPVGLLSIALIGVTGYAVQYFTEWLTSGRASSEEIEKQSKLIEQVANKWGEALPALRAYADELKRAADEAERGKATQTFAARQYEIPQSTIRDTIAPAFAGVRDTLRYYSREAAALDELQKSWNDLSAKMNANTATAEDAERVQKQLADLFERTHIPAIGKLADQFTNLSAQLVVSSVNAKAAREQNDALNVRTKALNATAGLLTAQMMALGPAGVVAFKDIADAATVGLGGAIDGLSGKVKKFMEDFQAYSQKITGTINSQVPFQQLSPLVSANGQFMDANSEAFQHSQFDAEQYRQAGASAAAEMIKGFEGFIGKAKWDVNHFRVGFGSDTITDAAGRVSKVTKDTVATLADAERDLSRRIVEFQDGIQKAIGLDTWKSLSDGQQAALTSIAYNYGSLPKKIVEAINSGGGPEIVAKAIAGLSANPTRRAQEASTYLSGTGYSMSALGLSKNPEADRFREAAKAAREFEKAQKAAAREAQNLGSAVGGALKGLVDAFQDGKLEAGELLDIVAKLVIQIGRMPGGFLTGSGSFLGGILGAFFHDGGVVGGPAKAKAMSPGTWSGAKRYHKGGIAGLQPGEVPAILQRGEIVIPRGARMGGSGQSIIINAPINAPGADAAQLARVEASVKELGKNIPKMVDKRVDTRHTRGTRP